jgi:hypothetical protein
MKIINRWLTNSYSLAIMATNFTNFEQNNELSVTGLQCIRAKALQEREKGKISEPSGTSAKRKG